MTATVFTTLHRPSTRLHRSTTLMSPRLAASATSASKNLRQEHSWPASGQGTSAARSAPTAIRRSPSGNPKNGHFKMASDARCGKCHEDRLDTTGKPITARRCPGQAQRRSEVAAATTATATMTCARLQPGVAPLQDHILATCQQCHPKATAKFTNTSRTPIRSTEEYPPSTSPSGHDGAFGRRLCVLGGHTLAVAIPGALPVLARLEEVPRSQVLSRRAASGTRFLPFERFSISWSSPASCCWSYRHAAQVLYTHWARTMFNIIGRPETAARSIAFGASSPSLLRLHSRP